MRITNVEKNKKSKNMLSIFVDDEYSFSMTDEDFISLGLYEERDITEDEIKHIRNELNFRRAKSEAVKYLTFKLRSEKEVFNKLVDKEYEQGIAQRVIEELKSMGYINDKLYVQKYIFDRSKLKPKSKKLLKYELMARGISEHDIDEIMSDWKVDETVVAEAIVRKRFGKYNTSDEKVLRKIYSFLRHRGFGFEVIQTVANRINNSDD